MDNELLGNGNIGTESKKRKVKIKNETSDDSGVSRVVISKEADDALKNLLSKARDGFDGGQIERSDIVNWLLNNHEKLVGEAELRQIRSLHFDEMLAWNKLTKLANQSGGLSEELKAQFKSLLNSSLKKSKE